MTRNLWTVILAAGAGRRLSPLTGGVPKQFWKAGPASSLLEDTIERMAPLAPPERTLVVVDRSHADYVRSHHRIDDGAWVLYQPQDRGTAAGVLFAIDPILRRDPGAIVVMTPSDHGIADDARFRRGILEAARHARTRGGVMLFGVVANDSHDDYGWIKTDGRLPAGDHMFRVASFVEKPHQAEAVRLLASGALWNTMILVARVRDLHRLLVTATPELAQTFADGSHLTGSDRTAFFAAAYRHMPVRDFSHHVLAAANDLLVYQWPAALGWSDLGTPQRLLDWQSRTRRYAAVGAA